VPDWFVKSADEIVMVDATTGALLNRLKRGDVYAQEKAQQAMENFFKESNLAALRELALRQTAHELDFREAVEESAAESSVPSPSSQREVRDRILILITADSSSAMLIRRGRRMADYLGADCFAVCVSRPANRRSASDLSLAIERHLNFARNLHIETRVLEGDDPADTIVDFARRNQVTHILLSRRSSTWWNYLLGADLIFRVVRKAKDIRVIIVAERRHERG
jgi:two-component system, OmpR family, sensor histidine kinase KdpD